VTNTPAGILEAAATLSRSPEAKEHLVALLESAQSGRYAGAEMLDVIDGILGAVSIDDEGRPLDAYDTDGYAVALAALSGDEVAQGVVQMKRTALRDIEQATQERRMRAAYERSGDTEPIPVDQVCVVHATKYGIKRDEYGNVFLRPAAQERPDQFPRASVHFTLNSRVESHAMGAWDDTNRMIVARLDKTMEASKTRPRVLESVDTWFINGPGEVTILPDAVVVEPQADLVKPIVDDGNGMIYFRSGENSVFNDAEQSELTQMANSLGVSDNDISRLPDTSALAREVALRMAMQQQGIDVVRYADIPSSDGIKTGNQRLSEGVWSLAHRLGVESGLHMGRPEERLESEANRILHAVDRSDAVMQSADAPIIDADLRARRQELVSGYLRATPAKVHETTVHF
jgi:hypothetical protein